MGKFSIFIVVGLMWINYPQTANARIVALTTYPYVYNLNTCKMPKKIEYVKGQMFGKIKFLKEVETPISDSGRYGRNGSFKCYCKKVFTASIGDIKSGHTKSCGCYKILTVRKQKKYVKGEMINGLEFIRELEPNIQPGGQKSRRAIFKCYCGNNFEVTISKIINNQNKSCGCYRKSGDYKVTHGDRRRTSEHYYLNSLWRSIKRRCYGSSKEIKYWGALGVKMNIKWKDNYLVFKDYILANLGERPTLKHSIDRFPNKDGNYEPGNIRWATQYEQVTNLRSSKLSVDKVKEIKGLLLTDMTLTKIASIYNVTIQSISMIKRGVSHKDSNYV